jgi:hypothetical protein
MMRRRTFGGGIVVLAGAGVLALSIPVDMFAQTAPAALRSGARVVTAENVVPGITNDSASVSSSAAANSARSASSSGGTTSTASLSPSGFPPDATMMKMPSSGASSDAKPTIEDLRYGTRAERRLYARAAAAFPSFCSDWAHKLRVREADNLNSLNFQEKSGYETASYVGYGPIKSCECKESAEGIPLGKVTYDEQDYFLEGKTIDEAKHSSPKLVGITHTLEIFSWDKEKWFY